MADGDGCKCAAYDESECACDADWTPQELIDARAEIERLRLTDEEVNAITYAITAFSNGPPSLHGHQKDLRRAYIMRAMLARHRAIGRHGTHERL